MEASNACIASWTADLSSSSSSVSEFSEILTSAFKITVSRLLSAVPATVTRDARARALNTVIGIAVKVGIKTGNTVAART